jgi:hypothetical protein|tara:strand:- start:5097 stop:5420 length:324 start_codon:yes stop_codon:yes gene_type:complete
MANDFKNGLAKDVGTSAVTIYTTPSLKQSIVIECDVCNTTSATITTDVFIDSGGQEYYIVKNAPVPTGGTLQVISNQKIILEANEVLKAKSNAAASIDVIASVLEDV